LRFLTDGACASLLACPFAMKFATDRPYADPEAAARKLIEIANSVEAVQGRPSDRPTRMRSRLRHHRARPAQLPRAGVLGATHKSSLIDVCYATIATKFRIAPK
jgi:hypothetical protein